MPRRALDQYFTPKHATRALLANHRISGSILEPCAGHGDMAAELWPFGFVQTNDIDPGFGAWFSEDATQERFWSRVGPVDWVISNPPYNCCVPIIRNALASARHGVAMLLRLSFLEPCKDRADLLERTPPSVIVLPRISFTGDGKTDNVTCAWMIWDALHPKTYVKILSRKTLSNLDNINWAMNGASKPTDACPLFDLDSYAEPVTECAR